MSLVRRRARAATAFVLAVALATGTAIAAQSPDQHSNAPQSDDLAAVPDDPQPSFGGDGPEEIPPETASSEESETEHEDLSSDEAADVASEEFPETMERPGFEGVNPPPGMEIDGYVDDYAAIVEPEGNQLADFPPDDENPPPPGGVVASGVLPLRTENEADELRPVDTSLIKTETGYEQKNTPVEVQMPDDLARGVEIAGSGLGIEPVGAEGASTVEVVDDKAFYANLGGAPDTDFIVAPLAAGFEFLLQLRSADSPALHEVKLSLPEGAELAKSEVADDGVDVVSGDELLATISAPLAFDSKGREVPVKMKAKGERLELKLSHLDAGWEFPILVDPVYDYYGWKDSPNPGGYPTDINGWFTGSDHPAKFTGYFANGLQSRSNPSTTYPDGAFHEWIWQAPPYTFIERVDFYNADLITLAGDGETEENYQGFYAPSLNRFETGQMYVRGDGSGGQATPTDRPPNWSTPYGFTDPFQHFSFDQWVGNNRYPDWTPHVSLGPDPEGQDANMAIFALVMKDGGSPTNRQCCARTHLRGALLSLYDRYAPRVTSSFPQSSSTWVDDGSRTYTLNASARDDGLGMRYFAFYINRVANDASTSSYFRDHGCPGGRFARCPASYSATFSYQLPEGRNRVELIPYDIVGWWQNNWPAWNTLIDRTAPVVNLSGSLYQSRNEPLTSSSYTLRVDATDGSTAATRLERSGVKSIEILLDGARKAYYTQTVGSGSKPMDRSWTFDAQQAGPGRHQIQVKVEDQIGHKAPTRYIDVFVEDQGAPSLTATHFDLPGDWTESADPSVRVDAHDDGLGIAEIDFRIGCDASLSACDRDAQLRTQDAQGNSCLQTESESCPRDVSHAFDYRSDDLAEGLRFGYVNATDTRGNRAYENEDQYPDPPPPAAKWTLRIDRSEPEIELSGGLVDAADPTATDLDARAIDGTATHANTPAEAAKARSGVKSLEIRVNGERELYEERTREQCNGGAVWGSCELRRQFDLDPAIYGDGRHQITVIAVDFLGHRASRTIERTIDGGPPRIVRIESSHAKRKLSPTELESRWLGAGEDPIETQIFAEDTGRGVERFELKLPGGEILSAPADCAAEADGECPEYTGGTMHDADPPGYDAADLPEGESVAEARAFDARGEGSAIVAVPYRIDHTDPVLDSPRFEASPLYQSRYEEGDPLHQTPLVRGQSYTLDIHATDDKTPERLTAGVRTIEVLVEDPAAPAGTDPLRRRAFFERDCEEGGCDFESAFVFDTREYPDTDQPLTVRTVIADGAGNEIVRDFEVKIAGEREPEPERRLDGLEQFFHYDSTETGLSGAHVNLATGNLVWHATPLINPGRGLSSVLNLTYNSFDHPLQDQPPGADSRFGGLEYDEAGPGFSIGISGITRLNEPLGFYDLDATGTPATVVLTDPDGTAHTFKLKALRAPTEPGALYEYDAPPGVNLHLRRYTEPLAGVLPEDQEEAWAITRPDGVTYFFDGHGFLRSIEDRNGDEGEDGNRIVYDYQAVSVTDGEPCEPLVGLVEVTPGVCEPRLRAVIDPAGTDDGADDPQRDQRSIKLDYYPLDAATDPGDQGRIETVTDHADRTLSFDYENGRLARLTQSAPAPDPGDGLVRDWQFGYDPAAANDQHDQLSAVIDPRGAQTAFAYYSDPEDRRVLSVTNRRQSSRSYQYFGDQEDQAQTSSATVTDARAPNPWRYEFDVRDRLTAITDPLATRTELAWDTDNNVIELTEAATSQPATIDYTYNNSGLLLSETDPLGRTTRLEYIDHAGRHRSQIAADGASIDDGGAFVSDLIKIIRPQGNLWSFDIEQRPKDEGPYTGNVEGETDPTGGEATATYDRYGNLTSETDEAADRTTYSDHDLNGIAQKVVDPRGNAAAGDPAEHKWLYRYDEVGNLLYATDPRGSGGHSPGADAPPTFTTELTYDGFDRLIAERVPKDSASGAFVNRSYAYDRNDNQTKVVDGEGRSWKTDYTPMDRPDVEENPAGEKTDYRYDTEEGLTKIVAPEGFASAADDDYTTEFVLDHIGRRVLTRRRSTEQADLLTSYAYDDRDNVIGVADAEANDGATDDEAIANAAPEEPTQRLAMAYDVADQLTAEVEDPAGEEITTEYRYDENGNQRIVFTPRGFVGDADPAAYALITDYDDLDRPIATTDQLGNQSSRTYYPDGKLESETSPNGNATGPPGDFTTTYSYNENDELTERTIPWAEGQYGPRDWMVSYARNEVGDPIQITDALGNEISNTFFDSGELKSTDRPSWWRLDWGAGSPAPDPGGKFSARPGGLEADTMVPAGGPALTERQGAVAGGSGGESGRSTTVGAGDFGRVEAEPLPDMLPRAGIATLAYDDEMRLRTVTDAAGQARGVGYDEVGRIATKSWAFNDAGGITHAYAYDRNGNLERFTDGAGVSWDFTHDQFDRLARETAPGASDAPGETFDEPTTYRYDPNGTLASLLTPRCASDAIGCPESERLAFEYRYDSIDRLISESNPANEKWEYGYDAASNRTSETSPRGFDPEEPGGPDPAAFTTELVYDRADRLAEITDPLDAQTTFAYDANSNRTRVEAPGASTPGAASPPPRVTQTTYDGRDLVWQTTTGTGEDERTTVTEYDANSNLRRVVNPAGVEDRLPANPDSGSLANRTENATLYEYDPDDQLTQITLPWSDTGGQSDENGVDQSAENAKIYRQKRTYDNRGRLDAITFPFLVASGTDPSVPAETDRDQVCYEHFETAWIRSSTEPKPGEAADCQTLNPTLTYDYTERGLQKTWTGVGAGRSREIRRSFYDNGTLATRSAEPGSAEEPRQAYRYFYNRNRSLVEFGQTEPAPERVTLIDRDRAERETLVNETWAADRDTLHRYDAAGNATERLTDGTYDRQAASYQGGTRTSFIYDEMDRETRMNVTPPSGASRTTTKDYYPSGELETRTLSSGTEEAYSYATDGLLVRMTRGTTADPTAKKDQAYAYDLNSNRTKDERGRFQYNARSQLVKWIEAKDGSDEYTSFVLNGSGATLEELTTQGPDTDYAYTADRLDSSKQSSADERTHYDYNDFGSIVCARLGEPEPADPCDTAGADATDFEYRYDAFERRIGSEQPQSAPNSEDFTYAYDGLDRRDLKTDEATGERFELAYVGTSELLSREAEQDGGKSTYDYDSTGARQGQSRTEGPGPGLEQTRHRSFGLDANGSVESLLGENGAEVGSYEYDPYGELQDPEPDDAQDAEAELTGAAQENPFRFEGFYYDSGVKTYDMQARTYAPEIGRFYSQDRYEAAGADLGLQSDPLTQNRYVFAGGNPVTRIEWDGHWNSNGRGCSGGVCSDGPVNPDPDNPPPVPDFDGDGEPGTTYPDEPTTVNAATGASGYSAPPAASPIPQQAQVAARAYIDAQVDSICGYGGGCSEEEEEEARARRYGYFLDDVTVSGLEGALDYQRETTGWLDDGDFDLGLIEDAAASGGEAAAVGAEAAITGFLELSCSGTSTDQSCPTTIGDLGESVLGAVEGAARFDPPNILGLDDWATVEPVEWFREDVVGVQVDESDPNYAASRVRGAAAKDIYQVYAAVRRVSDALDPLRDLELPRLTPSDLGP